MKSEPPEHHEAGREEGRPEFDQAALPEAPQGWQGLLRGSHGFAPRGERPASLDRLQRSAGNASVLRMLSGVAPPRVARAPATPARALLAAGEGAVPGDGQMAVGPFLDAVHTAAGAVAEQELGELFRRRGCPWLDHWIAYYRSQPPAKVEDAVRRYAPAAARAATADDYVKAIGDRVREGIVNWRATGQLPGLPADGPGVPPGEALPGDGGGGGPGASAPRDGGGPEPAFKLAPGASQPSPEAADFARRLGRGEPVEGGIGAHVAGAFGADLAGVRVHRDAQAVAGLGARAVTVGRDIAFAPGEYEPGTLVGDALIAHELAHVVQQDGGGTAAATQEHERDADQAALGAVAGRWGSGDLSGAARPRLPARGLSLQRCPAKEVHEGLEKSKDLGLEIVNEPELPERAPVGSVGRYWLKQRVRHSADRRKGSSWFVDRPPGKGNFKQLKSADNTTSVTFDAPGTWRVLCKFSDDGKSYAFWHDQEVVDEGVIAQEAFAQTGEADYVRHRLTLGDELRKRSKGGELDQNFGGPYIENISPKGANPIQKHSTARQTFKASMPPGRPPPSRYRWWMIPREQVPEGNSTYQTRQDVPKKTDYKGEFALFLGQGDTASCPIKIASEMEIVCEMIGDDGKLAGTARYKQVVVDQIDMERIKALQDLVKDTTKNYAKLKPGTARGVRASYLDLATGRSSQLKLFIGAHADGSRGELLVDLTPGAKKVEYEGDSFDKAVTDFEEKNDYSAGRVDLVNPDTKIPRTVRTKGKSDLKSDAEKAGLGSLVLGALGIASAFIFPPAAPYLIVGAMASGAASGTMSIIDELRKAKPSANLVAIDAMSIVASLAGAGVAGKAIRLGAIDLALTTVAGRFYAYTGFAADATGGVLIAAYASDKIEEIRNNPSMTPDAKVDAIARIVSNTMLSGLFLAFGSGDLVASRTRILTALGKDFAGRIPTPMLHAFESLHDSALPALKRVPADQLGDVADAIRRDPVTSGRLSKAFGERFVDELAVAPRRPLAEVRERLQVDPAAAAGGVHGRYVYGPDADKGIIGKAKGRPDALRNAIRATADDSRARGATVSATVDDVDRGKVVVTVPAAGGDKGFTIEVDLTLVSADKLTPAHIKSGGEAGPGRIAGVKGSGGKWSAQYQLLKDTLPENVPFILGHGIDEMVNWIAAHGRKGHQFAGSADLEVGVFTREYGSGPPPPVTSHDRAAARELLLIAIDYTRLKRQGRQSPGNVEITGQLRRRRETLLELRRDMGLNHPSNIELKYRVLREEVGTMSSAERTDLFNDGDMVDFATGRKNIDNHTLLEGSRVELTRGAQAALGRGAALTEATVAHILRPKDVDLAQFVEKGLAGGHQLGALRDFAAANPEYVLRETARAPAGGVNYVNFEVYKWTGPGPPPPANQIYALRPGQAPPKGWQKAGKPKTTFDDPQAFLAAANREAETFRTSGKAVQTAGGANASARIGPDGMLEIWYRNPAGGPFVIESLYPHAEWLSAAAARAETPTPVPA